MEGPDLERMVTEAYPSLMERGVYQDDPILSNLILVDGERIVNVGLERVYEAGDGDDVSLATEYNVKDILRRYRQKKSDQELEHGVKMAARRCV